MEAFPSPKFPFQVDWGGVRAGFSEVTGLDGEVGVHDSYITLKRGVIPDNECGNWLTHERISIQTT